MQNKFPGKDISLEDLKDKIPLAAKKYPSHKSIVKVKDISFGGNEIPFLTGPNTVESFKLINDVGKMLSSLKLKGMRGGAFKPLTFPYRSKKYFEPGVNGLNWLKQTKKNII